MIRFERSLGTQMTLRHYQIGRPPDRRPAAHPTLELTWVLAGRCRYRIGRRAIEVLPGEGIAVSPTVEHTTEIDPGTEARALHVDAGALLRVQASPAQLLDRSVLHAASLLDRSSDADLLEVLAEGIVARFERTGGCAIDPRIQRAVERIEDEFDQPLSVAHLAETASMSPFHFSRVFREATGKSPHRFLLEHRVRAAASALEAGASATEAAFAVGFSDLATFGRAFRSALGCTPGAYRKIRRNERRIPGAGGSASVVSSGACDGPLS